MEDIKETTEQKEVFQLESLNKEVDQKEIDITIINDIGVLLLNNLTNSIYKLEPNQIKWIETFINNSPQCISELTNELKKISESGEIDVHQLPHLVKVFASIYNNASIQLKEQFENTNILVIIQYTLDVLMEAEIIKIANVKKETISNIIDTSLFLLGMQLGKSEPTVGEVKDATIFCCKRYFGF